MLSSAAEKHRANGPTEDELHSHAPPTDHDAIDGTDPYPIWGANRWNQRAAIELRAEAKHVTSADEPGAEPENEMSPRIAALRDRLNHSFIDVDHGEYFRSRIHGLTAYRSDVDVPLPTGVADRLTTTFKFDRAEDAENIAALDAFIIAYHAAESYWRYLIAMVDGHGPKGAPAIAMAELQAGREFNDRVSKTIELSTPQLTELLDYLFLPSEVIDGWTDQGPSIAEVREYLRLWCRSLGRFLSDCRNAYNSAKHGLAVAARPTQMTVFTAEDPAASPAHLFNGPTLCTVETEIVRNEKGKPRKHASGRPVKNWFWAYRAIDPDELIAQTVVTADLLDWLRAMAQARLIGADQIPLMVRSEPKPLDIRRPNPPGRFLRIPLAAEPLPPEATDELLRHVGLDKDI